MLPVSGACLLNRFLAASVFRLAAVFFLLLPTHFKHINKLENLFVTVVVVVDGL